MRTISSGTRAQMLAKLSDLVFFVEAEFRTALARFWSGAGSITWKGQVWSGASGAKSGAVLSMEPAEETAGVEATGFQFVLSGLDEDLLRYCQEDLQTAKKCRVWMGYLNPADPSQLADEPLLIFEGRMDAAKIETGATGTTIKVNVESELRRLKIPSGRKLTNADQQIDFPGDRGLELMSQAATWKGTWGTATISAPGGGGGGGGDPTPPDRMFR